MPRLPSAQDINRQTPSVERQIVALPVDPMGKTMQQAGSALQQTGAQLQKQAYKMGLYEERLLAEEKQKLIRTQKAFAQTGFVQDLNDWQAQAMEDTDYATQSQRFNEFAQKALQKYSTGISDEEERTLFELSAKQDISNFGLKLRTNAYDVRNKQLIAGLDDNYNRSINQISATNDVSTIQRIAQTQIEQINTLEATGTLAPSQAAEKRRNIIGTTAYSQLDKKAPEDILKIFNGESVADFSTTGNQVLDEAIDAASSQTGVPKEFLIRTVQIESGGKINAKNPNSTAAGAFQLLDSTAKTLGVNPYDVKQSTMGAAGLYLENRARFEKELGREPTNAEMYVMHQQGAPSAMSLFKAAFNGESAFDALTRLHDANTARDMIVNNGGSLDMSAEQFVNKWVDKFDGRDNVELLQYISPAQQKTLKNKTYGYVKNNISTEFDSIKKAAAQNAIIPNETFDKLVTQAKQVGEPELAQQIKTYSDNQQNISLFAGRSINEQMMQLSALQSEIASGNNKNAELYGLLKENHTENLKQIEKDPLDYYAKTGLTAPVVPLDLSSPNIDSNSIFRELVSRRESINEIKSFEGNNPDIPILSENEIDALKVDFEKGEPAKFVSKVMALKEVMTQDEFDKVAYKAFKANSSFAVALAQEPQVATAIMEGERLPTDFTASDFKVELDKIFNGMFVPASQVEGLTNALTSYYKAMDYRNTQLGKGSSNKSTVDKTLVTQAITDIIGEPIELDNNSKVFSFKDNTGVMVDDDRLQNAIDSITDEQIIQMNGGLPQSDMGDVSVDEWRDNAMLFSKGDGKYGVMLNGARLVSNDGKTFVLDLKKIINGG